MKNARLITEVLLVLIFVGLLGWQQTTIASLRRGRPEVAVAKVPATTVLSPPEAVRRKAEVAAARTPGTTGATATTTEVAVLQTENRALRQQMEALVAQQRQAHYILTAEGMLSGALSSAHDPTRPPDTTGLRPDGQVASWSPRQAIGAPDTPEAGDVETAWASREPDGGEEWLQLSFGRPVDIAQINVHETYNPGAISRISALLPDGSEKTLWEGTEPPEQAPVEVGFSVPPGVRSDQIKVYMDTARVPGWNEVDAVELVGSDGSRQWASSSSASSYYGDRR